MYFWGCVLWCGGVVFDWCGLLWCGWMGVDVGVVEFVGFVVLGWVVLWVAFWVGIG